MTPDNWMQTGRIAQAVERLRLFLATCVLSLLCCGVQAQAITEYTTGSPAVYAQGIVVGPDGNLWFTGSDASDTGKIGRINPTTFVITYYGTGISPNFRPVGIALGPDGNLWFTEYYGPSTLGGSKVGRIDPATGIITEYSSAGLSSSGYVHGIAAGADGNLWFTETDIDKIGSINPATGVITEYGGLTAGSQPWGITAGADGNLWFTEFKGRIGRINPVTGSVTEFTSGIQTGAILLEIVQGPDGNLWFTDSSDYVTGVHAIGKIDPATGISVEYSLGGKPDPQGITVGADHNLWFTESSGIGRIDPSTAVVTLYTIGLSPNPYLQRITAGPDGNLWFAEYVGRIGRIVIPPVPASIIANPGTTPQSTAVNTPFAIPLAATVKDAGNNPVPGVSVQFALPAVGASGTFPGAALTATATTNASGIATSPLVTANATIGSYSATATAAGVAVPATFSLQNTVAAVAALAVSGGNGQSTRVSTAFPIALTVKATDGGGMPVGNATVQFGVPAQAATAVLSAISAVTDINGLASVTATASAISGAFQVTATSGAGSTSFNLTNTLTIAAGNTCGANAATNADLVEQYYAAILRRPSDAGGKAYWVSEADRLCGLGADPKEAFFLMANTFYNSLEYLAFNRDATGFVTDNYITFYGRLPDAGGLSYWTGQIAAGMPRNIVMSSFLFSPEFTATMNGVFPGRTARAETYLTLNLFGGFFRRLADSAGYTFWDGQFRTAQCNASPAAAVQGIIDTVSSQFLASPEYAARGTTNSQYVQDLYYALLQRGGDLPGFNFWVGQLTGGVQSRGQVRQQFLVSPEMQVQSAAIAAQGCLP